LVLTGNISSDRGGLILTGNISSKIGAKVGNKGMASIGSPGNLSVAPLAPFLVLEQGQDSAALILVTAPQPMLGIDPAAKEDSIAASPLPDLGSNRSQTEGTGGGQAGLIYV
jgi:hypothetical protein